MSDAVNPYAGDDYPREGCRAAVDVFQAGYRLSIYTPNGALMESYAIAKTPAQAARMLCEWCEGKRPALHGPGD